MIKMKIKNKCSQRTLLKTREPKTQDPEKSG